MASVPLTLAEWPREADNHRVESLTLLAARPTPISQTTRTTNVARTASFDLIRMPVPPLLERCNLCCSSGHAQKELRKSRSRRLACLPVLVEHTDDSTDCYLYFPDVVRSASARDPQ